MTNPATNTNASAATTAQKFPLLSYDPLRTRGDITEWLIRTMMSEKRANALLGYCFVFDENESVSHSRNCPAFRCSCSEMARAARDERKALQLFKNANYEIAVRLS